MAVRDKEQRTSSVDRRDGDLPWRVTLGHLPAVLAVGAVIMYGYLSTCYERFYGSFGVDPSDVGLSYTGTLARSSGFVIAFLLAIAAISRPMWAWIERRSGLNPHRDGPVAKVATAVVIALLFFWPLSAADDAGRDVLAGKPVEPIRFLSGNVVTDLQVLAIHADPAIVEPAGKPEDSPAAEQLHGRELLYLGQSGGTAVLYDAARQRAIYVPASSIILHIANCDARQPTQPPCEQIDS